MSSYPADHKHQHVIQNDCCNTGNALRYAKQQNRLLSVLPCRGGPNLQQGSDISRWFSALLLQNSFAHVGSTLLLFAAVAGPLERRYGTWRIFLLALIAGVAGNFFSASVEV